MSIPSRIAALAGAAALVAGCGEAVDIAPEPPRSEAEKAGYLPAPEVVDVATGADGAVIVRGRAKPLGRVRGTTLAGEAYGATADDQGRFGLEIQPGEGPLLAAVSAEEGDRSILAQGWLFVPQAGSHAAVILRPGAPARPLGRSAPLIATVDFDPGGGLAVSGRASPGAEVRLRLDGQPVPPVRADGSGRYGFRLTRVPPGDHLLQVDSGEDSQQRTVNLSLAAPDTRLTAARMDGGWRVQWATPGGGSQTTLIFADGPAS